MLENVFVQEKLQKTISFASLFVLTFECFKDMVIDRPRSFYCLSNMRFEDGKCICPETDEYKHEVRNLEKKPLHASMRWFVSRGAIVDSDLQRVVEIELRRNDFVHELFNTVNYGISELDIQLFADLISIYKKIDSWWIYNVEIDWDEIKDTDSVKMEECFSCALAMIDAMVSILLKGEGDTYRKCYMQIKDAVTGKVGNNITSSNRATS